MRIITARVQLTCHDGTRYGDEYRLATTLTDPRRYPADALIELYHERWEHEITYLALRHTLLRALRHTLLRALRHTLLRGRVLRSGDPAGLHQER